MEHWEDVKNLEKRKDTAIDVLTDRFSKNELPMEEYERLVADINRVKDSRELAVIEEIVGCTCFQKTEAAPPEAKSDYFSSEEETQSSYAILSERRLNGNWLHKARASALSILGTHVIDMRALEFVSDHVVLDLFAFLGEIQILVSPEMGVQMEAVPFAGETVLKKGVHALPRHGAPTIVIKGSAILGSIVVKQR